ncbi:hypothetical protein SESBI_44405 [Sesbania bispinosa]|nr:hypothetical protein SESBI_44405 [Sesbania bispinosa]
MYDFKLGKVISTKRKTWKSEAKIEFWWQLFIGGFYPKVKVVKLLTERRHLSQYNNSFSLSS